jgi:hypothetical protein
MTKIREQQAKRHRSKAKERTKHEQVRDAHREFAIKPRTDAPKKKNREDVNQAAARIVSEATKD